MTVSNFTEADGRILDVYPDALAAFSAIGLGDQLRSVLTRTVHPEKVSQFLELCYANAGALPLPVLEAATDVGAFAATHGFYGLGEDERGWRMVRYLRGEAVATLPEPKAEYLPAEEEPIEEEPLDEDPV